MPKSLLHCSVSLQKQRFLNRSNITKPLKHLLWVQSVAHMSDERIVTFAMLILDKDGVFLKIPLSCGYKDIIKNQY